MKRKSNEIARQRNVFAVRRQLSPSAYEDFKSANDRLSSELGGTGRVFTPETLTVTVIGFSRFTKDHQEKGPSTLEVIERVNSADHSIRARIGKLGIFGANNKYKLGFRLQSEDIQEEVAAFENAFSSVGYPLRKDPNSPNGTVPHCSVALLFQDRDSINYFNSEQELSRLDNAAKAMGTLIRFSAGTHTEFGLINCYTT